MADIHLRCDDKLAAQLVLMAKAENRSVNQQLITIITEALAARKANAPKPPFSRIVEKA